jgi:putative ABC transport system permease protein
VSADYFSTLRIPLVRGRVFTDRDAEGPPNVVIINSAAARRYWPDEDPLGRRIDISFAAQPRWMEIVGVVGDVKHAGLELDTDPEAFMPLRQPPFGGMSQRLNVVIRTRASASTIAPMVRSAVNEIDRNQPVGTVSTMEDLIAASVAPRRLNLWLVVAFAVIALVLTAAGLYGVMSYLVSQRTREIGVRMALGATRSSVLPSCCGRQGDDVAGIAIGLVGALALTRFLATLLFGVTTKDPFVYFSVAALLAAVALLAAAIPSSRATRVDPMAALRS